MSFYLNLRRSQFSGRLPEDTVYADWTGAALAPNMLFGQATEFLSSNLIGNPHSHHAPSAAAMEQVRTTRAAVLNFFRADPGEYEVVFTSGATGAIRILHHFRMEGGELLLTADNHNSVNGLREDARRNGAVTRYAPLNEDLSVNRDALFRMLDYPRSTGNRLFAYPAKSNYAGTLHPLEWVGEAQRRGWSVLLDAAAYAANCRLDLSKVKPDFIPISFYKMFGWPTGLGCLLIRKDAYPKLHKRWFAGGSILLVSVAKDFFAPESLGYARFEDGSVDFGNIPLIKNGLRFRQDLPDLAAHASGLATNLYDQLSNLKVNGRSVKIHSRRGNDTVTFSVADGDRTIDAWHFERFASERGVYVRTGCFCNPGANECVFGYGIETFERMYNDAIRPEAITVEALREFSGGKPIGAIRASFGYANVQSDIDRFADVTARFLETF